MRPAPSAPASVSDIEEANVLRVLLDELASRLDLVAHQGREDVVRLRGILDLDTHEHALRRVHRRLPELQGIHLAETLEPRQLHALLREVERLVAELTERLGV